MVKWILATDRIVTNAVWALAAGLLAVISVLGLYQVLIRFVFNQPSSWTEEVIGRLLIWTVALGVAAAFRQGALVSVDVMLRWSRGRWHQAVRLVILILRGASGSRHSPAFRSRSAGPTSRCRSGRPSRCWRCSRITSIPSIANWKCSSNGPPCRSRSS
jgi:uncharacterized membrane protein